MRSTLTSKASKRTVVPVALLCLTGLLGLSACGGLGGGGGDDTSESGNGSLGSGDGGSNDSGGGFVGAPEPAAPADGRSNADGTPDAFDPKGGGSSDTSGQPGGVEALVLQGEAIIKTGAVSLTSNDVGHVLTEVYGIVGGVGGEINKEDTTTDAKGKAIRSTLVLRVPVDEFNATMLRLSSLGTLVNRVSNANDVTIEVADIDSRVRSAQRSIATLRQLFSRATTLNDIIRVEGELAQRESELEALQAQQRALADKTSMSTITMTLELPPTAPKPKPKHEDKAGGFVSGIHQGWDALKDTAVAVGHFVGLVLPLGTLAALLLALVLWIARHYAPKATPPPNEPAGV